MFLMQTLKSLTWLTTCPWPEKSLLVLFLSPKAPHMYLWFRNSRVCTASCEASGTVGRAPFPADEKLIKRNHCRTKGRSDKAAHWPTPGKYVEVKCANFSFLRALIFLTLCCSSSACRQFGTRSGWEWRDDEGSGNSWMKARVCEELKRFHPGSLWQLCGGLRGKRWAEGSDPREALS